MRTAYGRKARTLAFLGGEMGWFGGGMVRRFALDRYRTGERERRSLVFEEHGLMSAERGHVSAERGRKPAEQKHLVWRECVEWSDQ